MRRTATVVAVPFSAARSTIAAAIETLLRESGPKTREMDGQAGTADVGNARADIVGRG